MDVQSILVEKISKLSSGEHSEGVNAVRLHIESAVRHFKRGQQDGDETSFTDAIYRCNQAFEGSIKEAYRVLALKNPEKVTPAEIEAFLASGKVLRKKVLDQFTNYRREWRNPSTHDYKLDFDEDEALLAIVSVAVFAIVLCDQIESKLAFVAAQAAARAAPSTKLPDGSLLDQVAEIAKRFAEQYQFPQGGESPPRFIAEHVEGALGGFMAAELAAHGAVSQGVSLDNAEVDLVVKGSSESIGIELKVTQSERAVLQAHGSLLLRYGLRHIERLTKAGHVTGGVVLLLAAHKGSYEISFPGKAGDANIRVVSPTRVRASLKG
jgi:hypothetical protein